MNPTTITKPLGTTILSRRTSWLGAALDWLLGAVGAVLAQPTVQFATSAYTLAESVASVTLTEQRLRHQLPASLTNVMAVARASLTAWCSEMARRWSKRP